MFKRKSIRISPVNFCESCNDVSLNESLLTAVSNNHLECAQEYLKLGASNIKEAFEYACTEGYLAIAKETSKTFNGIEHYETGLLCACYGGQVHVAIWCASKGASNFEEAVHESVTYCTGEDEGNIECAKWCMSKGGSATWPLIFANAYKNDTFYNYCEKLVDNGHPVDINTVLTYFLMKIHILEMDSRIAWCIRKGALLSKCKAGLALESV